MSTTDRFVDFAQERIDLALRLGDLPDSQLIAKRVVSMDFATVAAPSYLADRGTPKSVTELADHSMVGFLNRNRGRIRLWSFQTQDGPETISPNNGTTVDDPLTFRELLLAGVGIGQAPSYLVGRDISPDRLIKIFDGETKGTIPLSFVFPRPLGRSTRSRTVMQTFEEVLFQ